MKKTIPLLALFFMLVNLSLPAFAETEEKSSPLEVMSMIDAGLDTNYFLIKNSSKNLSSSDRLIIFNSKKKNAIPFSITNGLLGFGVGSFILGDWGAGLIQLGAEVGVLYWASYFLSNSTVSAGIQGPLMALTLLGARGFGAVKPFIYTDSYNTKLTQALNGKSAFSLGVNSFEFAQLQYNF